MIHRFAFELSATVKKKKKKGDTNQNQTRTFADGRQRS